MRKPEREPEHSAIFMPGRGEGIYVPAGRTDIVNNDSVGVVKTEETTVEVVVSDTGTEDGS